MIDMIALDSIIGMQLLLMMSVNLIETVYVLIMV